MIGFLLERGRLCYVAWNKQIVTPAEAGVQARERTWIPVVTGMTSGQKNCIHL